MRFDDSLTTILSADMSAGVGARSAWRQLVDLLGRQRIPADEPTLLRLRQLRNDVPVEVRAASARALAFAEPGAAVVGLFAEEELAVAAPVLRTVSLDADDWLALLPRLSPQGRSVLRHRRDLPASVVRGLESFGGADFVLDDASTVVSVPEPSDEPSQLPPPAPDTPRSPTPFIALADVARGLPVVAEALRATEPLETTDAVATGGFRIADLVERIDAFTRTREPGDTVEPVRLPTSFRFQTDRTGVIVAIEGVPRGVLIGANLADEGAGPLIHADRAIGRALAGRRRFAHVRIEISGRSEAAGVWHASGGPLFDRASGRFLGLTGIARLAASARAAGDGTSESLRQLVHELRTPTNAIAGFAELIEAQLLGPVAAPYRRSAIDIRDLAHGLAAAIADMDTAARIEGRSVENRPAAMPVQQLLHMGAAAVSDLAAAHAASVRIGAADFVVHIDDRLALRLIERLLAALVAGTGPGEVIQAETVSERMGQVAVTFSRPMAFATLDEAALLAITLAEAPGGPPLGIGLALRLARSLAQELGGSLTFGPDRLTLRLPAAVDAGVRRTAN